MKVMCKNCGKIIEANPNQESVYCNQCGNSFTFMDGKTTIDKFYKNETSLAYKATYQQANYEEGYKHYKEALTYRKNDFSAIVGMCLSRVYGQAYDDIRFSEVKSIIDEYDIALDAENSFIFLNFTNDLFHHMNYFLTDIQKRLEENGVFMNRKYFEYFVKGVLDIESLLDYFKETISLLDTNEFEDFIKEVDTNYETTFKNLYTRVGELKKGKYAVAKYGDMDFDFNVDKTNIKTTNKEEVENLDVIIPDRSFFKRKMTVFGICAGFVVCALILLIVGTSVKNDIIAYCAFIPLGIGAIIFAIFYFKNKKKLK